MKIRLHSPRLLLFALASLLGAGSLALYAENTRAERPPMKLQTDDKAIDRDATSRVSFSPVVKKTAPSVVNVFSSKKVRNIAAQNPFFHDPMFRRFFGVPDDPDGNEGPMPRMPGESVQQSLGSGVIVSRDGYILTNNHVVDGADEVKVAFGEPSREFKAEVVGRDAKVDIAVLKIDATDLPAATLGDSDKLEVGDTVLTIGNPFGIGLTVTHGIVSALSRGGLGIEDYEDFIQTDAPINPGNSGGALLDSSGRVIGINTAILSRSGGFNGVGFAIPINLARSIAEQLVKTGHVERGFMGVNAQPLTADLAKEFGVSKGALVADVTPDSPADKAGFKSGDVIVKVNGTSVDDPRRLALTVSRLAPGTEVKVEYVRNGKTETLELKLGTLPSQSLAGGAHADSKDEGVLNGVTVGDLSYQARRQFHVPDEVKGALVTEVSPDSASARAGLREGDVILSLDRKPVKNADEAVKLSEDIKGPKVTVRLWRDGGSRYLVVDESP
ncbi:MAG: DegQ family serine endoprotease [Opitutaceae bacterium]|jgi:serine protease Do